MSKGRLLVGLALALVGCGRDSDSAKQAPPPTPVASPEPPRTIDIYVDNQLGTRVAFAQIAQWPRVDTLVPVAARRLGTWDDVFVRGKGPKPAELHRIADQHPDLVPALYPIDDHTAGFGLFDPVELANHRAPQIHEDGVSEIRIQLAQGTGRGEHESGEGGGTDPSQLVISIVTPTGTSKLEGKTLLAIPRQPLPGETGEGRGWPLATVLDAAHITKFDKLLLADGAGLNLTLEKADFSADSVPYVKLNRQGSLRFNLFKKQGTGWQRSGDLRGLVSIQVLK
jgi:hypothetical protein